MKKMRRQFYLFMVGLLLGVGSTLVAFSQEIQKNSDAKSVSLVSHDFTHLTVNEILQKFKTDLEFVKIRNKKFKENILDGLNLTGLNLSYCDLSNQRLRGTLLFNALLSHVKLAPNSLDDKTNIKFLVGVDLRKQNLKDFDFKYADLTEAQLPDGALNDKELDLIKLVGVDLTKQIITVRPGKLLFGVDLSGSRLAKGALNGHSFNFARLSDMDLTEQDFSTISFQGNNDLSRSLLAEGALNGKALAFLKLIGTDLRKQNLQTAQSFEHADLTGSLLAAGALDLFFIDDINLNAVDLTQQNLQTVKFLKQAKLITAKISSGNLNGMSLSKAVFRLRDLQGQNLVTLFSERLHDQIEKLNPNDLYPWLDVEAGKPFLGKRLDESYFSKVSSTYQNRMEAIATSEHLEELSWREWSSAWTNHFLNFLKIPQRKWWLSRENRENEENLKRIEEQERYKKYSLFLTKTMEQLWPLPQYADADIFSDDLMILYYQKKSMEIRSEVWQANYRFARFLHEINWSHFYVIKRLFAEELQDVQAKKEKEKDEKKVEETVSDHPVCRKNVNYENNEILSFSSLPLDIYTYLSSRFLRLSDVAKLKIVSPKLNFMYRQNIHYYPLLKTLNSKLNFALKEEVADHVLALEKFVEKYPLYAKFHPLFQMKTFNFQEQPLERETMEQK